MRGKKGMWEISTVGKIIIGLLLLIVLLSYLGYRWWDSISYNLGKLFSFW